MQWFKTCETCASIHLFSSVLSLYISNELESQDLVWPTLDFNTAWTHLSKLSCNVLSILQEQFSTLSEGHSIFFFGCWLPFFQFSVNILAHCFNNVEVRSKSDGTFHSFKDFDRIPHTTTTLAGSQVVMSFFLRTLLRIIFICCRQIF